MAACPLGTEHGDDRCDGTDKSRSHMHAHDAEEHRRGRRDRNPQDNDTLIGQERPAPSLNPSGSIAVIHTSLHRYQLHRASGEDTAVEAAKNPKNRAWEFRCLLDTVDARRPKGK
jgi:hypothetical protein